MEISLTINGRPKRRITPRLEKLSTQNETVDQSLLTKTKTLSRGVIQRFGRISPHPGHEKRPLRPLIARTGASAPAQASRGSPRRGRVRAAGNMTRPYPSCPRHQRGSGRAGDGAYGLSGVRPGECQRLQIRDAGFGARLFVGYRQRPWWPPSLLHPPCPWWFAISIREARLNRGFTVPLGAHGRNGR